MATKTYRVDITVDASLDEGVVMFDYDRALSGAGFTDFTTVEIFEDDENSGCSGCGIYDAVPDSKYCSACTAD
jgi:hypothetical protein